MDTIWAPFSEISALFPIFKKGQGRPPKQTLFAG